MKQWKKMLAGGLAMVMVMGFMPAKAWAAAAKILVEPSQVYAQVYAFDSSDQALARRTWESEEFIRIQASDAGIAEVGTVGLAAGDEVIMWGQYDPETGKYGYMDADGRVILPAVYDRIDVYQVTASTKILPVKQGEKWGVLDTEGKQIVPFQYDEAYSGDGYDYVTVCQNGKWGIVDAAGTVVVPMQYEWGGGFDTDEKGTLLARFDGSVVYDLTTGQERFRLPEGAQFDYGFGGRGVAVVYNTDNSCCLVDSSGRTVIPFGTYEHINVCNDSIIMVGKNRTASYGIDWAVAKVDGTLLSDFCYNGGYDIGEGMVQVSDPETYKVGCVDSTGKLVVPMIYEGIRDFDQGIAVASKSDEDYTYFFGMIDAQGNEVLPFEYDFVTYSGESDYFWVEKWEDGNSIYGLGKLDRSASPAAVQLAYARTQNIEIDGTPVSFQAYALKDAQGNETNYVKLRDVAFALNGSAAQFQVAWDGEVTITTGAAYTANGSEMKTPYAGDRSYEVGAAAKVNGQMASIDSIVLKDDGGNGYTYYKLRDLGEALGFTVDWTAQRGVFITTH